jgi:uncharacterized protein DUF4037
MCPAFVPGIELARQYHGEQVGPLLAKFFPGLEYSAALVGRGSDVQGFDTPRSTDHDWGPRLKVFLADPGPAAEITALLADRLPELFRGYQTVFPRSGARKDAATHWVEVSALADWLSGAVGFDPRAGVGLTDWLATPTQVLAEVTGGAVFHDGLAGLPGGGLGAARAALGWYPADVWRYVLACQWQRIGQEEPFPGRCAEAGDELGSALVAGRLVRDVVRLVLLMQRRYPPYSKWLGAALARTPAAAGLLPLLTGVLSAGSWAEREENLCGAYEAAARMHNDLNLTAPLDPAVRPTFYDRPYRVLDAERLARALRESIDDVRIRSLPSVGAIDQFIDSTDAIGYRRLLRAATTALLGDTAPDHGAS